MGLSVTFVSGLRGSGKSSIIKVMIERLWRIKPHYIRLLRNDSPGHSSRTSSSQLSECELASTRNLEYDEEHVFEIIPEVLTAIHRQDRYGSVVIEADADNTLRHAYPYDHRVFMMGLPRNVTELFRDPCRAAEELKRALDDTTAFASEMFGLGRQQSSEDADPSEPRLDLTDSQLRGFLYSPLGDELATRIQLQQPFHGLVESDVIVVNTSVGAEGPETADCLRRIDHLLERIRGISGKRGQLFLCDPAHKNGKACRKLLKALKPMCQGGK